MSGCKCASKTDEWHGWECSITEGPCMYFMPDSKKCAEEYGEGPDACEGGEDEQDLQETSNSKARIAVLFRKRSTRER